MQLATRPGNSEMPKAPSGCAAAASHGFRRGREGKPAGAFECGSCISGPGRVRFNTSPQPVVTGIAHHCTTVCVQGDDEYNATLSCPNKPDDWHLISLCPNPCVSLRFLRDDGHSIVVSREGLRKV